MERREHDEPTEDPAQCLLPRHVKRALVYMRGNVAEKITLPGLAAACGAPERTLLKQFKGFVTFREFRWPWLLTAGSVRRCKH